MRSTALITGGTGLIGREIISILLDQGWRVHVLSRSIRNAESEGLKYFQWQPDEQWMDQEALENVDVIFHLAGAPVAQRWTNVNKDSIMRSRIEPTELLLKHVRNLPEKHRPKVCISASAIGLYENSEDWQSEISAPAQGFLSEVVQSWESEVKNFEGLGLRTAQIRIGLVLSPSGGMLKRLLPVFRMGIGSAVGSGTHWQSWIHVEDAARMFVWASETSSIVGPLNAVAPNPVRNHELSRSLARACRRPFWAPRIPAWVLRVMFGSMASIVLASQRVSSDKAISAGFQFNFVEVETALESLLNPA